MFADNGEREPVGGKKTPQTEPDWKKEEEEEVVGSSGKPHNLVTFLWILLEIYTCVQDDNVYCLRTLLEITDYTEVEVCAL